MAAVSPLTLPRRILMGPGPSDVDERVLRAMSLRTIGHLDPAFVATMDEVRSMLQQVLGTTYPLTLPMSGTGSAGMETCLVNLLEPDDTVLVGVNGVFGTRMCEVAKRCGAEVVAVEAPWGRAHSLDAFRTAAAGRSFRALCLVQAETSTGVLQDLSGFSDLAAELGALLVVDAVTSLGGCSVDVEAQGIDAVYSGTQKCLSCPPGLSPVSFSEAAVERIRSRIAPPQSWYLDLGLIARYWLGTEESGGTARAYHHTAPINAVYGLHEALRLVLEEGLEARYARHRHHSAALSAGLAALGLDLPVPPEERLPQLTLVQAPEGVDEAAVRRHLLKEFDLEIGGGLGALAGRAWRIGLMGSACTRANVELCLTGLESGLRAQGWSPASCGIEAAIDHYEENR
ncbi:MAG: alanine--glyoxylate aminotransferase family protein [Myxococcota bacterium]|nr:alanine--glyoxylate aminotransferase family protein [Myxococcota bacterium]